MTDRDQFSEACRREWERLGVPRDRLAAMLDELAGQLHASPGDELPDELDGYSTGDARAFADAWARERGAVRPRLQYTGGRPGRTVGVVVLLALFAIGGVAAVLEFRSPSEQESRTISSATVQTGINPPDLVTVPDLLGISTQAATQTAQAVGIRIGDVAQRQSPGTQPGIVLHESPNAGARIPRGTTITLVVSR